MQAKPRNSAIDYAKAFGIFAICVGHFAPTDDWLRVILYSFNIPLFVFVSGYLKSESGNFVSCVVKLAKRILVPYCVWFLISNLAFVMIGQLSVKAFLVQWLFLNGTTSWNSALWFLPCIFAVSIIFECLIQIKLIKKYQSILTVVAIVFLAIALICDQLGITTCIFGLNKICLMEFFYILGYLLKKKFHKIKRGKQSIAYIIGIIAMCALAWTVNFENNISMLNCDYNNIYIYVLFACIMTVLIICICGLFHANHMVELVSKNTLFIMSTHLFFRLVMQSVGMLWYSNVSAICIGGILFIGYYIFLLLIERFTFSVPWSNELRKFLVYIGIQV